MKQWATAPAGALGSAGENGAPPVVRVEVSLRSLLLVLALLAGLWALFRLIPVLLVLVAAFMIIGALNPLVGWVERRKAKRSYAIAIVFVGSAALVFALATVTIPTVLEQVKGLIKNEPRMRETAATYLERSTLTAPFADDLRNVRYAELAKSSGMVLLTMGSGLLEVLAYSLAAVFLAFYMMLDHDRLRGALFAVVPRRHHLRLSAILLNLGTIVGGYIRGQMLTCLLMSAFLLVLLLACGVPNALAIAVFGGMMDVLPYLGAFLTMAPAVLAAAAKGPTIAIIVFTLLFAYEEFESRVLVPLVYGKVLRLPSSVVFFSLLMGATLGGIAGALLALPLAAAVLMLVEELRVDLPGEADQPETIEQREKDDHTEREYERRAENLPAAEAAAVAVEIATDRKRTDAEEAALPADDSALPKV